MRKRINSLWIVLSLVFVVILNIIIFLINTNFTTTFWVSYGFIHFAYLMLVISSSSMPKAKNELVFGYPLIYVSSLYFICAFLIGSIFIYFKNASFISSFIPQLIIAGLYVQAYISNIIINEKTISNEIESQYHISYIKNAASELSLLMVQSTDPIVKKKLEKLYDSFRSSQVKSYPSLFEIEERIKQHLQILKANLQTNDYSEVNHVIETINGLLMERNGKISGMH
ncbi:hypothetical protein PAECIP111802_05646 [Paenibacillus allorhizosphaerae]|uniref:Uncharacterized protein n=2 Tax=Paenibacillus allorhizosphaerae TaxID=2849866 RepID=A0ABN7TVH3_9BACL|nr:hypothetical protein PAECIP111802_05646 [Paenibacillus allorhizosphaerae]